MRTSLALRQRLLVSVLLALAHVSTPTAAVAAGGPISADGSASLAAADFNGDGRADLAVASPAANAVAIYLRQSDGTLPRAATRTVSTGTTGAKEGVVRRQAVAAGDLNRDGKADLVVADSVASVVSLLFGNGDGSFRVPVTLQTLARPTGIALADFNGDSHVDVAIASQGTNKVTVLLGTGGGSFKSAGDFAAGTQPTSVVTGDFGTGAEVPTRDGRVDIAVTATADGEIAVLFGDGRGGFSAPTKVGALGATAISAADFNGDGALDLATCNTAPHFIGLTIGFDQGNFGCFSNLNEEARLGDDIWSTGLVPADFDGDGNLDLAVAVRSARAEANGVLLFLSRPQPGMRLVYLDPPVFCPTAGGAPGAIVTAATSGKGGVVEVAVADERSDRVWVLSGDGKGGFANCAAPHELGNG